MVKNSKVIIMTLLFCTLNFHAFSQGITLKNSKITVKEALEIVKEKTGYTFVFEVGDVDTKKIISLDVLNQSIDEVVNQIISGQSLVYEIKSKNIVLKAKTTTVSKSKTKKITGLVTDEKGEPVIGASVVVSGSNIGSITTIDGQFTLEASPQSQINISYIGYKQKIITVNVENNYKVVLEEATKGLDEVVVVGYGTQKKRDVSSAISSISGDELKGRSISNFAQGIAGTMAGVQVQSSNAAPGGGQKIVIRGVSSLNASSSPLYVVDGFAMPDGYNFSESPLNSINPGDIQSIEVLKDASSSAIYGTRATNGVVLITTKKGKTGKPKITFSASNGIQNALDKVNVLDRSDFLKYMEEARANAYILQDPNNGSNNLNAPLWKRTDPNDVRIANWNSAKTTDGYNQMYIANSMFYRWITVTDTVKNSMSDTNWQNVLIRPGKVSDYQLSVNGGTDDFKYYISGNYNSNDGLDHVSGYERFSLRSNLEARVTHWLKVGLNLNPTLENTSVMGNSTNNSSSQNPYITSLALPPIINPYLPDGRPDPVDAAAVYSNPWAFNFFGNENPLLSFLRKDNRQTVKINSAINTEVKFFKDLIWRTDLQSEYRSWSRNYFSPSAIPQNGAGYNNLSQSAGIENGNTRLYYSLSSVLTYLKSFDKHNLTLMAGYSAENTAYSNFNMTKYDFPTDKLTTLNQAITIKSQTDIMTGKSSESMVGMFGRMTYNYANKYYLTASIRRDGSSKFGENSRWGIFPSFSTAWRISDEKFFSPLLSIVNDAKFRGGWGIVGNAGIPNYLFSPSLTASTYPIGISSIGASFANSGMPNPNLSWETSKETSIGTDLSFLNSRISLSVDYYYRLTDNMLYNLPLLAISGFGSVMTNIGSMRNKGLEYQLETRNLVGKLKWTTSFNLSYNRSRVLSLSGLATDNIISGNNRTAIDRPLAAMYGGLYLGPYKDWSDVKTSPILGATTATWKTRSNPGDAKFADINGDGIIDGNDQTVLGKTDPDYIFGITNKIEYKGFDFSVHMNAMVGGLINASNMIGIFTSGNGTQNVSQNYFDNYWRPDNVNAKYPMPSRKSFAGNIGSGMAVFSATHFTIDNMTLGYNLNSNLLRESHLSSLRIYFNIQNLYQWKKYPGFNVENTNSSASATSSQGTNLGAYPTPRVFSLGVNIEI